MKRQGKFTGRIYDEDYDFSQCSECCTMISEQESKDEEQVSKRHMKDLMDCMKCFGCPAAMG